jgi:hypothetical protein
MKSFLVEANEHYVILKLVNKRPSPFYLFQRGITKTGHLSTVLPIQRERHDIQPNDIQHNDMLQNGLNGDNHHI